MPTSETAATKMSAAQLEDRCRCLARAAADPARARRGRAATTNARAIRAGQCRGGARSRRRESLPPVHAAISHAGPACPVLSLTVAPAGRADDR